MPKSHKNQTEPITHGVLDKVQFGDRFGKLLIEKGFTVESFSFASGISETTIKEIKYGRRLPSLPKYVTIIETLQISDILLLQNSISPECNDVVKQSMIEHQLLPILNDMTVEELELFIQGIQNLRNVWNKSMRKENK